MSYNEKEVVYTDDMKLIRIISIFKIAFILFAGGFSLLPETPVFQEYFQFHKGLAIIKSKLPKLDKSWKKWIVSLYQWICWNHQIILLILRKRLFFMESYQLCSQRGYLIACIPKHTRSNYFSFSPIT